MAGRERITERELEMMKVFVEKQKSAGKTKLAFTDLDNLLVSMKEINGGFARKRATVWSRLKRLPEATVFFKSTNRQMSLPKINALVDSSAKDEVEKIVASFAAKMGRAVKKASGNGQLKAAQKKITIMEKEMVHLQRQNAALREVARASCRIRQEAILLTQVIAGIKKKYGVDIHALVCDE